MKTLVFLIICISFMAISCRDTVVRDANVYKNELEFVDAASDEQVERGKALIAEQCECSEIAGVKGFTTRACGEMAETVLVIEARMKYHTSFMRYLGGISDKRPAKEPPVIPATNSLCK